MNSGYWVAKVPFRQICDPCGSLNPRPVEPLDYDNEDGVLGENLTWKCPDCGHSRQSPGRLIQLKD